MTGAAIAADESQSITLGTYYTVGGVKLSTVEQFYGKTESEIEKLITGNDATDTKYVDVWRSASNSLTINTGNLYLFSGTVGTGQKFQLTTLTLSTQANDWFVGGGRYAAIKIGEVTYTATQTASHSGTANTVGKFTFDFSAAPVTFSVGNSLTFTFNSTASGEDSSYGVFKGIEGPVVSDTWKASVQLKAVAIPEPTTATLSLLALAGLAARRRRK